MSGANSDDELRPDELTERYRAASADDPARPSDSVRQAVLAHARSLAGAHAARSIARTRRAAANDSGWRITAVASVIVAGFATVLAWHSRAPMPLPAQAPAPVSSSSVAEKQPAAGTSVSDQPPQSFPLERSASNTALAPNAVTTRSRERTATRAETSRLADTAQNGPAQLQGGVEMGSRAAPTSATAANPQGTTGAGGNAMDVQAGVQPAAPMAPPNVVAERPLIPRSASPSARASATLSPLVAAAESGDLERVDQLLRSGTSTEQGDSRGRTALLIATLRGDVPMVQHLLAAGARANAMDADGDTPLAAARRQGSPELVKLLERVSPP